MTKGNIVNSFTWKILERFATSIISFTFNIVLARILMPSEFGVYAILLVLINLSMIFIQGGFNTAVIQKEKPLKKDYDTIFYFSFLVSLLLYILFYFLSPLFEIFYDMKGLSLYIRTLNLVLFFGAFNSIQVAFLTKKLMFKRMFFISFSSMIISGFFAIILAIEGYGIWALIVQQIVFYAVNVIISFIFVPWYPSNEFSYKSLKSLFKFGSNVFASNIINGFFLQIRTLLIGKIYTTSDLAHYNRGKQFPEFILNSLNSSIQSVMLVVYSERQRDYDAVKKIVRKSIRYLSYFIFPVMLGLYSIANPLIIILLTDKWISSVKILQVYSLVYMITPILATNNQALKGIGLSSTVLKLDLIRKLFEIIILFITIYSGLYYIAFGALIVNFVSLLINMGPNKKYLSYTPKELFYDIIPSLTISSIMFGVIQVPTVYIDNIYYLITTQIIIGAITYIMFSILLKNEIFFETFNNIRQYLNKLKRKRKIK
ncbi:hypothetical protein CI105_08160 [Candidatus Izimaplasma bacterium ZiA1]|uniref:lipopolysaccharide biosynthesis protein n=1 Tax=Candidatus Izimoplasma sp. ZiA1 TaxID=2024899 RepID=UPI000BAA48DD|nr:hypothetical protein CI105_08160 [Candidatus Izimaplasma bacterium ZiA1]